MISGLVTTDILFLGLIIQDDSLILMDKMKLSHICEQNALMKDIICISELHSDESHIQQVRLNEQLKIKRLKQIAN
jgi:hypothetical protein